MEQIAEIRRCYFIKEESISKIAKRLNLSRQTVRRALKSQEQPVYQRNVQPTPKLGFFKQQLVSWLEFDAKLPRRQRRTAQRLYECLQVESYQGSAVCTRLEAASIAPASDNPGFCSFGVSGR